MDVEDMIKEALNILTDGGDFYISQIIYDKKNFGNIYVVLCSNQVDIRFIKDRDVYWCEVGQTGEWYFIEDIFAMIGVAIDESNDFIDFMAKIAATIKKYAPKIFKSFAAQQETTSSS